MRNKVDLYSFTHYRSFLKSYYEQKRAENTGFSIQAWAMRANIKSKSTLTMILNGSRDPGAEVLEKLVKYFKFKKNEEEYFKDLVRLEKIKNDPRLSILLMEKVGKYHPAGKFKLLDFSSFEMISSWKAYAVREMVLLEEFTANPYWIAEKLAFKITVPEVKKYIDILIQLNLLTKIEDGSLKQVETRVTTDDDISNEALKRFHESNIDNAKKAVRLFNTSERYMGGTVFTTKKKNLEKAKEVIRRFEDEMLELFEQEGDATVMLNIQLFPLTKQ